MLIMACALTSPLHAAKYKEITVKNGGNITGKVSFKGKDPDPQVYAITKDNDVCGTGDRTVDYVRVNNGALTNVVVYLDKVKAGKKFTPRPGKLDQKGCEFTPFLHVMTNGQKISALKSDPVLHNIHTYELIGRSKKTVMNVSQPDQGSMINKKVKLRRGTAMKVECDAHDFMHGFVFVAKNPYYAVVGEDGTFSIDSVPPGQYKIKAWHGTLGTKKAKVTVSGGSSTTVNFDF